MNYFEPERSVNIKEELDAIRALLSASPDTALQLADTLIERCRNGNDSYFLSEAIHLKALLLHQGNRLQEAYGQYKQALELRKNLGDDKSISITLNNLGLVCLYTGKYREAITYFQEALPLKIKLGDYKSLTATYENLGVAYLRVSDYQKAIETHYTSLKISEQHTDNHRVALSYQNIGMVHLMQQDSPYALVMFEKALQLIAGSSDKVSILQLKNNIGACYRNLKDYPRAITCFTECKKLSLEEGYLTGSLVASNNLGDIYMERHSYTEAEQAYLYCWQQGMEDDHKPGAMVAALNLGRLYLLQAKPEDSYAYLQKALELSVEADDLQHQQEIYQLLSQVYEVKGEYNKALSYYKQYEALKGKILNLDNLKMINELKTKYEVDRQEKEIEINRLRNIELKDALEDLTIEKRRSEKLLLNILPEEIALEMKRYGKVQPRLFPMVTVMFLDIKSFTVVSEKLPPATLVEMLDAYFARFDDILRTYGIEKIKTIGDAYLCVSGLPVPSDKHAHQMALAALEMQQWLKEEKLRRETGGMPFFEFRLGIHSGPVVAGVVGKAKYEYDVWGDTVNTAARMEQNSEVGSINVSSSTYNLLVNDFDFKPRGKIVAKNKGEVEMFFLLGAAR